MTRTEFQTMYRVSMPRCSFNPHRFIISPFPNEKQGWTCKELKPWEHYTIRRCKTSIPKAEHSNGHGSGLLSHSCCGSPKGSKTNKFHTFMSQNLSSIKILTWIRELHHRPLGATIGLVGLLLYTLPLEFAKKERSWIGLIAVLGFSGLPLFYNAFLQVCRLEVDASVLMSISAVGSIYMGMVGEGLLLLILFQISHLLESRFTQQSDASLQALLKSIPETAVIVDVQSSYEPVMDSARSVPVKEVDRGTYILVKPGEQVPLDGIVVSGSASITVEHISGESIPVRIHPGNRVAAGSHNADGLLVLQTLETVEGSTPTRIANLAIEAQVKESYPCSVSSFWESSSRRSLQCIVGSTE